MRKRNHVIPIRLNTKEMKHLETQVAVSGLNREEYLRTLILGAEVRAKPCTHHADLLRKVAGLLYMPRRKRKVYDSYHGEIRFLSEQIRKLVCSTFGHTLVLFTSYSMMGNVYRELRGNLPFPLLKVWKDSQSVIREFKAQKNCVLFAAGSCWEGVDFPGDVVSSLIIVRLPFAVPDPVREAERERYQTLKEYIQKIIVPDMQIKLRQGFGRAIRTETDTCVVSILDSRAGRGGKYHKEVIDALPVCRITDRMADVENFIRNRKRIEYYM